MRVGRPARRSAKPGLEAGWEIVLNIGIAVIDEAVQYDLTCQGCGRACFAKIPPGAALTSLPEGTTDLMHVRLVCVECLQRDAANAV